MENNKRFVQAWLQAHKLGKNQQFIAEALDMSRQAVSVRAQWLRTKGVNLPKLVRGRGSMTGSDISDLNAMIADATK